MVRGRDHLLHTACQLGDPEDPGERRRARGSQRARRGRAVPPMAAPAAGRQAPSLRQSDAGRQLQRRRHRGSGRRDGRAQADLQGRLGAEIRPVRSPGVRPGRDPVRGAVRSGRSPAAGAAGSGGHRPRVLRRRRRRQPHLRAGRDASLPDRYVVQPGDDDRAARRVRGRGDLRRGGRAPVSRALSRRPTARGRLPQR